MKAQEKEYDPLGSSSSKSSWIENRRDETGRHFYDESPLLDPILWPHEWTALTDKQLALIEKLGRETETLLPEDHVLSQMGVGHASRVISFLISKNKSLQEETPITDKQEWFLQKLAREHCIEGLNEEVIHSLSKYEARKLIGKYRPSNAVAV